MQIAVTVNGKVFYSTWKQPDPGQGLSFGFLADLFDELAEREELGVTEEEQAFLEEVKRAEEVFSRGGPETGYVGLGYFLTKWRCPRMPSDAQARRAILDSLQSKGFVEVYAAPDGHCGIRANVPG